MLGVSSGARIVAAGNARSWQMSGLVAVNTHVDLMLESGQPAFKTHSLWRLS